MMQKRLILILGAIVLGIILAMTPFLVYTQSMLLGYLTVNVVGLLVGLFLITDSVLRLKEKKKFYAKMLILSVGVVMVMLHTLKLISPVV